MKIKFSIFILLACVLFSSCGVDERPAPDFSNIFDPCPAIPVLGSPPFCGDGICEPALGENVKTCCQDCKSCFNLPLNMRDGCCWDNYCWKRQGKTCNYDGCCDPATEDMGCDDCDHGNMSFNEPGSYELHKGCTGPVTVVADGTSVSVVNNRMAAYGYSIDGDFQGVVPPKEYIVNSVRHRTAIDDNLWHDVKIISFSGIEGIDVTTWLDESAMSPVDFVARANILAAGLAVLDAAGSIDSIAPSALRTFTKCGKIASWSNALTVLSTLLHVHSDNYLEALGTLIDFYASNYDDLIDCLYSVPMSLDQHDKMVRKLLAAGEAARKMNQLYGAYILLGKVAPTILDLSIAYYQEGDFEYCASRFDVSKEPCPENANNFCWLNGLNSGIHCDGSIAVQCYEDAPFFMEAKREECPNGCLNGIGCIGEAACELNFCQAHGYGSGLHCDGDSHVECGTDGACFVELLREDCAGFCNDVTGVCDGCSPGSGPCCDNAGNYRSAIYVCQSNVAQYGCSGDACGSNVRRRYGNRYCSGTSSSCSGDYGGWGSWATIANCSSTQKCVPGATEWDQGACAAVPECGAATQCTAGSGPCCDASGMYRPTSYACDNDLNSVFQCAGTGCGADVEVQYQRRYCSGNASSCTGQIKWDTSWSTYQDCSSTQICDSSTYTCKPRECSTGLCCSNCRYRPTNYLCNDSVTYRCTSSSCGGDVERRTIKTYCSGSSASCSGSVQDSGWLLFRSCNSNELCNSSNGTCQSSTSCNSCNAIAWNANVTAERKSYGISLKWNAAPGKDYYKVTRQIGALSTCPAIGQALPGAPIVESFVDTAPPSGTVTYGIFAIIDSDDCYEFSCGGRVIVY